MSVFRTIVAAIDFSETSDDALRVACELAATHGSALHLLHVIPDARQQAWSVEAPGLDFSALQQESIADAERMLAARTLPVTVGIPQIVRTVVAGLPAAREIAQYAASHGADLIVVGTHGYGPVRRLVLGSVADRVVRLAPCPVLTVPHHTLRATTPVWAPAHEQELTAL
ncbi:universal stress protein [Luteitalea sp.]|jgi:nucleotide-binding universal stress UspA family protein|uniref:universal stress protein n=1 Tax=Luteitalea sp. TaxID=2004800 RepID=UPI0037CC956B